LDGCIAELKEDLGSYDAEEYKKFAKLEMNNAKLQQTYSSKHAPLPEMAKKVVV
jgi:hypothetical protein